MPRDYCADVDTDEDALVSIISANGWRVELTGVDGTRWDEPLVGWGFTRSGTVVPLASDVLGVVEDLTTFGDAYSVYHPSSTPTAVPENAQESPDGTPRTPDTPDLDQDGTPDRRDLS